MHMYVCMYVYISVDWDHVTSVLLNALPVAENFQITPTHLQTFTDKESAKDAISFMLSSVSIGHMII